MILELVNSPIESTCITSFQVVPYKISGKQIYYNIKTIFHNQEIFLIESFCLLSVWGFLSFFEVVASYKIMISLLNHQSSYPQKLSSLKAYLVIIILQFKSRGGF